MKTVFTATLIALAATLPVPVLAADGHDGHGAMPSDMKMQSHAPADAPMVEGTVKKIDKSAGKLTIAHGPLESLGMPAMTMVFRAAEPGMLDQVKAGDKIRFAVEKVGGALTVTSLEPAQ